MNIDLGPSIKNSMEKPSDVINICSPKMFEFIHDFYYELYGTWHDNFNVINVVAGGNHRLIEPLLVFGGSVNEVDNQGKTPLMYSHRHEASQLLINLGANLHHVDHNGLTPIAHALMNLCDIYDPEDEGIDDEMGQNLVFLIEQRAIKNDPNCLILSEYLLKTYNEIPKSYIKKIQGFEKIIDQAQEVMAENRKDKLELFLNIENQVVKQGNLRKIRTKL